MERACARGRGIVAAPERSRQRWTLLMRSSTAWRSSLRAPVLSGVRVRRRSLSVALSPRRRLRVDKQKAKEEARKARAERQKTQKEEHRQAREAVAARRTRALGSSSSGTSEWGCTCSGKYTVSKALILETV